MTSSTAPASSAVSPPDEAAFLEEFKSEMMSLRGDDFVGRGQALLFDPFLDQVELSLESRFRLGQNLRAERGVGLDQFDGREPGVSGDDDISRKLRLKAADLLLDIS
jgi:hypothetical protein